MNVARQKSAKRKKLVGAPAIRATSTLERRPVPSAVPNDKATGAPTLFSAEMGALICERIASGESLAQLCRDPEMPNVSAIRRWLRNEDNDPIKAEFSVAYARARESLLEHWADEITTISDDGTNDYVLREVGRGRAVMMADQEHIQRSKLRVDSRKWLLSKLNAKKYGDKLDLNIAGQPGATPVQIREMTAEEAAKAYLEMMNPESDKK